MNTNRFEANSEMIGKCINQHGYSDIEPLGRIVGIKSKTILYVQPIQASENKTKMEWISGGFAGHCVNQNEQSYDFTEVGEIVEMRMSKGDRRNRISDRPIKYYDFNF